jgi:hypothetical protein
MAAALLVVAAAISVVSFAVKPSKARAFNLFYGSVFIDDNTAPVSVDLASGKPSVRLTNAYTQVSAKQSGDLDVVPLVGGTLLLDAVTGEFNMVDSTGFVAKTGGGVPLAATVEPTTSTGIASGSSAYIVRTGASGTSVYLVSQSTVSAAIAGGRAKPRAFAAMSEPAVDVATTAVSANTDLWLLAGSGSSRIIRQLSLPSGSDPGATLGTHDHGRVGGVAALGVSTRNTDGSGADVVAVASSRTVQIFDATSSHTVRVPAPSGVDAIMPATNQQGGFAFLYHSSAGWAAVHMGIDGSNVRVKALTQVTALSSLAVPAQSNGSLYTIDRASGALWRISSDGAVSAVPGALRYPILAGETSDFSGATVLARGARVVYNSRANLEALTVFTDDTHAPVVVDKRDAIDLNSNGATALTAPKGNVTAPNPSDEPPAPRVDPAQQVTDRINCKTTTQIPHIPVAQLVDRGSRSVQLQWTYPLLDRQDCAPSTYTVSVEVVSDNAPPPPQTVRVQGQTGVNLTGLFPDTQYKIVVTAYLNGKGTPSVPLPVRTSVEGPAAPTGVHATTDDKGNWTVIWTSCGGVQNGCVPSEDWTVVPQLCGNTDGLQSAPANGHLVGDPTAHTFSMQYKGSAGLLGRGLTFQVEGVGTRGTAGTPSHPSACTYSWAHPIPGNISVAASTPPAVSGPHTSQTKVTVSFSGDKNVDLGGVGGQLTYQLLSDGETVTQTGPTGDTSISLDGIRPGQAYSVRLLVSPPRQASASIALPAVPVEAAVANWPALSVSASFAKDAYYNGTLTLAIAGLASATARGETFDLTNSQLVCGNTAMPLESTNFDPATPLHFPNIGRADFNGNCVATIALTENSGTVRSPAYFGGNPSHATATDVTLPLPDFTATADQFTAGFEQTGFGHPTMAVGYRTSDQTQLDLMQQHTADWNVQISNDNGATYKCGSSTGSAANGVEIPVDTDCVRAGGTWKVSVTFTFFGNRPGALPFVVAVSTSNVPKPIDPTQIHFTAQWQLFGDNIQVSYSGPYDQATLNALQWTEKITSDGSPGLCNEGRQAQHDVPTAFQLFAVDLTACPPTTQGPSGGPPKQTTYTIELSFTDPFYGTKGDYKVKVTGTPN